MYLPDEHSTLLALRTRTLHQFVESLDQFNTTDLLIRRFTDFAASYGLSSVACVSLAQIGEITPADILVNTRPRTWVNEYLAHGFLADDPILAYSTTASQPFAWQEALSAKELTPAEIRVMNHSADHGICDGLVIPIFETTGRIAMVSLAGHRMDTDPEARSRLTLAAVYLHNRLAALRCPPPRPKIQLTSREREILKWIASGKSDWQIGQILDISQKTVNYHVENTKRKFGVATRIQAIVAALRSGILDDC